MLRLQHGATRADSLLPATTLCLSPCIRTQDFKPEVPGISYMSCPGAGFAFLVACSRADAEAGEDPLQCFGYFRRNRHRSPDGPAACQREAGALLEPVSEDRKSTRLNSSH